MRFADKVVLITGASSGIGAALAEAFYHEGAHLILGARRVERLEALSRKLENSRQKIVYAPCDVTQEDSLQALVALAHDAIGKIDVVVANAGRSIVGNFEDLSSEQYRAQFDTNIFGVLNTISATLNDLKQTQGRLVIVGSVNGYLTLPGISAYGMSKAAVRSLCESLTPEFKPLGISVTHVAPGFVQSEIRKVDNSGALRELASENVPSFIVVPANRAAREILKAVAARRREVIVTGHGKVITFLNQHFPWLARWIISVFKITGRPEAV